MRGFLASRRCVAIARRAAMLGLVSLAAIVPWTMADEPRPNPQRYIPARGLVAYIEFDGLRAHANAWEATAAHAMLAKTPAGAMMTDLARQITDRLLKMVPGVKLTGADLIALQDHLVREGIRDRTPSPWRRRGLMDHRHQWSRTQGESRAVRAVPRIRPRPERRRPSSRPRPGCETVTSIN